MLSLAAAKHLDTVLDDSEQLGLADPYPIEDHFIANHLKTTVSSARDDVIIGRVILGSRPQEVCA